MISADGGGSNGYRVRLWKIELQKLANELKALPPSSRTINANTPISGSQIGRVTKTATTSMMRFNIK